MSTYASAGAWPPAGVPARRQPQRKPIFWLTALLLVAGGLFALLEITLQGVRYPTAVALALVLAVLYTVPFFALVHRSDYFEREPLRLTLLAFAWGGLVAGSAAGIGNSSWLGLIAKLDGPAFAERWGAAIVAPPIEESLKVLAVVVVAMLAGRQVGSTLDGVIYGAMSGLGFQTFENISYQLGFVDETPGHPQVDPVVQLFILRNIVNGLWSHAAYTAIAGAGIAYFLVRRDKRLRVRLAVAAAGFLVACTLHAVWNSPALDDDELILPVLLLKGIPALVLVIVIFRLANRREATSTVLALRDDVASGLVTQYELDALATRRTRRRFRRRLRTRAGRPAARLGSRLQRAEARLAAAIRREDSPENVAAARAAVRETRNQLAARLPRPPANP